MALRLYLDPVWFLNMILKIDWQVVPLTSTHYIANASQAARR